MSVLHIRGDDGKFYDVVTVRGQDGKTAYEYAKDGGYTGTEEEFAQKLAQEMPDIPVQSVNGQTGEVQLSAADVGALSSDTDIPEAYILPTASAETLGGIIVGDGLVADEDGRVSVNNDLELLLSHEVTAENRADTYLFEFDGVDEIECYAFFPKIANGNTERVSGNIGGVAFYIEEGLNAYADKYCVLRFKNALGRFGFDGIHAAREGYQSPVKTIGMYIGPMKNYSVPMFIKFYQPTQGFPVGTKFDIYGKKVKRDA